jgi:uncharacterized tellurite resistance protein B-like protein
MKNQEFKDFLFKSAVMVMACDGDIADKEINEIKSIVANEIYFMGYDFEEQLKVNIDNIKTDVKAAINQYLNEIEKNNLNENQEILLVEVLLRVIEADNDVQTSELKFLQMVKAKLKVDEQTLIVKFPNKIDHLLDFHNYGLNKEFTDDVKFE